MMIYVALAKCLVTGQSHNSPACLHSVSPRRRRNGERARALTSNECLFCTPAGINELFTAAAPGIKCLCVCVFTVHANRIVHKMYGHSCLYIRNDLLKCISLSAGKYNVQGSGDSGVRALFRQRSGGACLFKVAAVTTACAMMYFISGHPGYF